MLYVWIFVLVALSSSFVLGRVEESTAPLPSFGFVAGCFGFWLVPFPLSQTRGGRAGGLTPVAVFCGVLSVLGDVDSVSLKMDSVSL